MSEIQGHLGDWAAVLVSLAAAGIAIWQAVVARRQATTAKDAAKLAERQADAAEAQVGIMREELDAANEDRLESWRPKFEVQAKPIRDSGQNQPYAELALVQTAGKALRQVKVTATGEYVQGLRAGRLDDWYTVGETTIDGMSPGGSPELLHVHFEYQHFAPIRVALTLQCTAREGGHAWEEHLTAKVEEETSPPSLYPRRRFGRSNT